MTAYSLARASTAPAPLSEQVTHASHRYLLPVVGGAATALGSLALLGRSIEVGPVVPLTLVGLGAATVGCSIAFHHWQSVHRARVSLSSSRPAVPAEPFPSPFPHRASLLAPPTGVVPSVPHSGIGRAAVSAAVGDRVWRQWESHPVGALGAPLTGPVAESAYVPPADRPVGPYAARDTDLLLTPSSLLAAAPAVAPAGARAGASVVPVSAVKPLPPVRPRPVSGRGTPFSEAELDALFPPEPPAADTPLNFPLASGEVSPIPAPRPSLVVESDAVGAWGGPVGGGLGTSGVGSTLLGGDPPAVDAAPPADQPSGRFRILPSLLSLRDPLYVETIHPIPPHLRTARRHGAPAGRPTSTSARAPDSTVECIGCLRTLRGFRGWVLCPGCHGSLCRRCLGASFLASSEGFCSKCRPWHARHVN